MFEFTDDYKTGIPTIDKEHEYLFRILNNAIKTLHEEKIPIQQLAGDLSDKLKTYALTHFTHEEDYMRETNDPELPRQKREHAAFIEKVSEFVIDDSLKVRDVENLLQFVVHWLFSHILTSDMMIGKRTVTQEKISIAFTKEYVTGIQFIDEEHKTLFDIIREANELIYADYLHDKYDEIIKILNQLRDYTEMHFQHEEDYMESIQYPKLDAQKRAHSAFIEKLVNINFSELDDIDDNQQQYLYELIDYLLDWLSNHILKSDCLISTWQKSAK